MNIYCIMSGGLWSYDSLLFNIYYMYIAESSLYLLSGRLCSYDSLLFNIYYMYTAESSLYLL